MIATATSTAPASRPETVARSEAAGRNDGTGPSAGRDFAKLLKADAGRRSAPAETPLESETGNASASATGKGLKSEGSPDPDQASGKACKPAAAAVENPPGNAALQAMLLLLPPGSASSAASGATAAATNADAVVASETPGLMLMSDAPGAAGPGNTALAALASAAAGTAPVAENPQPASGPVAAPDCTVLPAANAIATPAIATPAAASPPIQPASTNSALAPVVIHADDAPRLWGAQIEWTLKAGLPEARIEVSPANLGPVEVRVQSHAEGVNVQFSAAHASTRELLQEQLPRLRESLAASGIQLGDAQVGQGFRQPQPSSAQIAIRDDGTVKNSRVNEAVVAPVVRLRRIGLVDRYA